MAIENEDIVLPILKQIQARLSGIEGELSGLKTQVVDLDSKVDVKIDGLREDLSSDIESFREEMDSRFDSVQAALMDSAAHRKTTNQYVTTTSERHETDIADLRVRVAKLESEANKAKG